MLLINIHETGVFLVLQKVVESVILYAINFSKWIYERHTCNIKNKIADDTILRSVRMPEIIIKTDSKPHFVKVTIGN